MKILPLNKRNQRIPLKEPRCGINLGISSGANWPISRTRTSRGPEQVKKISSWQRQCFGLGEHRYICSLCQVHLLLNESLFLQIRCGAQQQKCKGRRSGSDATRGEHVCPPSQHLAPVFPAQGSCRSPGLAALPLPSSDSCETGALLRRAAVEHSCRRCSKAVAGKCTCPGCIVTAVPIPPSCRFRNLRSAHSRMNEIASGGRSGAQRHHRPSRCAGFQVPAPATRWPSADFRMMRCSGDQRDRSAVATRSGANVTRSFPNSPCKMSSRAS